jgi:hypothetical protein
MILGICLGLAGSGCATESPQAQNKTVLAEYGKDQQADQTSQENPEEINTWSSFLLSILGKLWPEGNPF